ncbi:MAG: response regulator transcription factor [Oscillospiraceae bacterium]|jgi:DNA-binding response OmpR family regulator|nr:response regulator transcription factor [Oscillospiraceae bacterium]
MQTILIVEDDKNTNQVITEFLKEAGYNVLSVFDGTEAMTVFYENKVALAVLDIMLPKQNGIEVLKYIRSLSNIPVIMLTALGDEYTQIKSFDLQADEYVTKPFSPIVLVKRIEALLKRVNPINNTILSIGDVVIDFSAYTVMKDNMPLDLTTKEIDIIKYLAENVGKVVSRQQILDAVWGFDTVSSDRTIDTHIKNIRKKLGVECISTVKNVGYKFEVCHEN